MLLADPRGLGTRDGRVLEGVRLGGAEGGSTLDAAVAAVIAGRRDGDRGSRTAKGWDADRERLVETVAANGFGGEVALGLPVDGVVLVCTLSGRRPCAEAWERVREENDAREAVIRP